MSAAPAFDAPDAPTAWQHVCSLSDIVPDMGVAALIGSQQVAIFRVAFLDGDRVFALSNYDPFSSANVLSRGIVGDVGGELVVASPIYKQHFRLADGRCVEDSEVSVPVFNVRLIEGAVQVRP